MGKYTKLSADELGQLSGGFSLHSAQNIEKCYLNNVNGNCGNGGNGDTNTNCSCLSCGKGEFQPPPGGGIGTGTHL